MSLCVSPRADSETTKSSTLLSRRCFFLTMPGSKAPALLARHLGGHRPGLGQRSLRPGAVAAAALSRATSLVGLVAQAVGDLALQGGLQHQLRQLAQQPVLPGSIQVLLSGTGDQLRHQRPIHRRYLAERLLGLLASVPQPRPRAPGPPRPVTPSRHPSVVPPSSGITPETYGPVLSDRMSGWALWGVQRGAPTAPGRW